ncbi:MAG: DUF4430 domain-containing protein [Nanoarchaeota archaeon]
MKKENLTNWIYAIVLLGGLIIIVSLIGQKLQSSQQSSSGTAELVIKTLGTTKTERFKFSEGTPLGIIKYNHSVKTFLNDNFVECIDGVCADGNYLWLLKVNNKTVNYGAKRYELNDGDIVMFEFTNRKGEEE